MPEIWQHTIADIGDTRTVALAGELDMSGADELSNILTEAIERPGATAVRIDLAGVDFLDSSAMHALIQAHQAAESCGRGFAIVRVPVHVRKVLEIAGLLVLLSGQGPDQSAAEDQLAG